MTARPSILARPITPSNWRLAFGFTALGFVLRLFWALRPRAVHWDEPDYLLLARNLLHGRGYQILGAPEVHIPPIGPWLAAVSLALGSPIDLAMSLWHVLAGALFCGLIFLIAAEIGGNRPAAMWTAFLAALASPLIVSPLYWGSMTESVFLLWLWLGLWAVWRLLNGGGGRAGLAAGLALALSYLTRPEALLWWALFVAIAVGLALWRRGCGRDDRRQAWRGITAYVAVFLLLAGCYWLYLYRQTGQFLLSGKTGITLLQAEDVNKDFSTMLDSSGQEVMWLSPERYQVGVVSAVESDPLGWLRRLAANLRNLPGVIEAALTPAYLLVLIGLGLWAQPWRRRRLVEQAFWLACLAPLVIVPLTHLLPRLLLPLLPAALVWAGQGLSRLVEWGRGTAAPWPRLARPLRWLWPLALALLMVALAANGQSDAERTGQATIAPSHKQAGIWLAANSPPGQTIMTRNSEIPLYAGRQLTPLPNASLDQALAYARLHNAGFMVIDDVELRLLRPQFAHIADPGQTPPQLEQAAVFTGPLRTTYIFRLR